MECGGAEFFLGSPPSFAWTKATHAEAFLPAIGHCIDHDLSEWPIIKRARPRDSQAIRRVTLRDRDGAPTTVYSDVRLFLRDEDRWLVLDLSTSSQGLSEISLASSWTPEGWDAGFIADFETEVRKGGTLGRRRMTPSGTELEFERTYTWDDLYLDEQVKKVFIDETEGFFGRKALYAQMDLPFRRGVLLHGPPGTGKTRREALIGRRGEDPSGARSARRGRLSGPRIFEIGSRKSESPRAASTLLRVVACIDQSRPPCWASS